MQKILVDLQNCYGIKSESGAVTKLENFAL